MEGDGGVWRVVELDGAAVERLRRAVVLVRQRRRQQLQLLRAELPHLAQDVPDHMLRARRRRQRPHVPEVAARPLLQRLQLHQPGRHPGRRLQRPQVLLQLVVERVRLPDPVEDADDGEVAFLVGVHQVELQREALPVDGVLRRRVPVDHLELVLLLRAAVGIVADVDGSRGHGAALGRGPALYIRWLEDHSREATIILKPTFLSSLESAVFGYLLSYGSISMSG